jgi:hypothetical protein
MRSGRCDASDPFTKNVAFTPRASSASRRASVSSVGPSSIVSQTSLAVDSKRVMTGPGYWLGAK